MPSDAGRIDASAFKTGSYFFPGPQKLADPKAYVEQIDRMRQKGGVGYRLKHLEPDELTLLDIGMGARQLAKILARTVSSGEYRFAPQRPYTAVIEGKERTLYHSCLTDAIVTGVVGQILTPLIVGYISPRVYSYQKGRSSLDIIRALAKYLQSHRRDQPDKKKRGLFVVKRDVSKYGESIPVVEDSLLWSLLEEAVLTDTGLSKTDPFWALVRECVRPVIRFGPEQLGRLDQGVPTGSSIQPLINNLYLTPLDREMESFPGAFYARFGDDFLFAHPEHAVAKSAIATIDETVMRLGLTIKPEKRRDFYFTQPGRHLSDDQMFKPSAEIEHLGCGISFTGRVRIKNYKAHAFLKDLRQRIRNTRHILRDEDIDKVARALCGIVNQSLDPIDPLSHQSAQVLHDIVNDRSQLKHFDYLIAREIAQSLTGLKSVKAFRQVPYRVLRNKYGLASLVVAKNRRYKQRKNSAR